MSNSLRLEVTGQGKDRLIAVLQLCHTQRIYMLRQSDHHLVLSGKAGDRALPFPPAVLADTILDWLARPIGSNPNYLAPTWPKMPDLDGDCERGWRVVNGQDDCIEIHPHWMIYHK